MNKRAFAGLSASALYFLCASRFTPVGQAHLILTLALRVSLARFTLISQYAVLKGFTGACLATRSSIRSLIVIAGSYGGLGALWQTLAIVCSSAAGRNFGCLGAKTRPGGAFFGFEPGRCRFLLLLLCSLGGFAIRESILGLMKTALSRG